MLVESPYEPDRGLIAKIQRRMVQWRSAAPVNIRPPKPILSLTFDDCPKSATQTGARILDEYGVRACFYIASKLIDTDTVMGRIAGKIDLKTMFRDGHELGAHTHSHIDCAIEPEDKVIADIEQNLAELDGITGGETINSFAFPFGETSFSLKQKLAGRFSNLRGVLAGINRGLVDRAQLRAYEQDGSDGRVNRLLEALNMAAQAPSWVIMFTHDVSEEPSGFGITPVQLRTILDRARDLGVEVMTPSQVVGELGIAAK